MRIRYEGGDADVPIEQMALVTRVDGSSRRSELMDGIYFNLSKDSFLFVSQFLTNGEEAVQSCLDAGMEWETFDEASQRLGENIFAQVYQAVTNLVIRSCEQMCEGANGE